MTKKDYVLIAKALKSAEPTNDEQEMGTFLDGWLKAIREVTVALATDNPKFDIRKFSHACTK